MRRQSGGWRRSLTSSQPGAAGEALKLYAEGAELIRTSSQQLDEAKLKIETLFPQEVLGEDDDE